MRRVMVLMIAMMAILPQLSAREAEKFFSLKVYPLIKDKCYGCHGEKPEKLKGDFDVRSLEAILRGGESGKPGLVKGYAEKSLLFKSILWIDEDLEMPPKENDRLTKEQIALIRKWIDDGAVWVAESERKKYLNQEKHKTETADGLLVKTSGGLDESWTYRRYKKDDIWAYQPLKQSTVPVDKNPVDFFIHKKLLENNIKPASKADRRTLIRRVTYGMTGLPPSHEEIQRFVNDVSDNAWEKVVDRLLASKHYGEQWGQHWLDVARYSDTSGFANDWEKSNAWRYRDYVIRSLNNDKAINQFFIEQIAGDELKPGDAEMTVATGFLRMGPHGTAMVPDPESRQQYLDDITNSVGETFLATPLKCASCHDHKFDPIPTKDYYSIQAVFATTHPGEMPAKFLKQENREGFQESRKVIQMRLKEARLDVNAFKKKEELAARKWMKDRGLEYKSRMELINAPEDKKPPRFIGLTIPDQGLLKVREQDVRMYTRMLERYEAMAQSVYSGGYHVVNEKKLRPPKNLKKLKMPETHILAGGSLGAKGSKVSSGVLSAVSTTTSYKMEDGMAGRRLAFAKWLTADENSLVIRTFVNRIWQGHFGKGIAANPNNFGKTGAKPSHPELLDSLSVYFRDNNWSAKKLHKLILMSETYQIKSTHSELEKVKQQDPNNKLLAYFNIRRLSSEEFRDTILETTGELRRKIGGLPIFPEINMEVATQPRILQFSLAPVYQPSRTRAERHRRSIYIYHFRGMPDPFMSVFNKPNANDSCERRDSSSVTPQVFTLFNSENSYDRSIAFALRLQEERRSLDAQVKLAFQLAYGRQADQQELKISLSHVKSKVAYHKQNLPVKNEYPKSIQRSHVEEMSGISFDYTERLDIYENFESDIKMWEVSAETRALADLCLILINSNEFAYIY